MRADFFIQVINKLGRLFPCFRHQVKEIEVGKDAIALGDMATEAITAAILPADERILFLSSPARCI